MSPFAINTARRFTLLVWLVMLISWTMIWRDVKYVVHATSPVIIVLSLAAVCCAFVSLYRNALYICGAHLTFVSLYWYCYFQDGGAPGNGTVFFGYIYLLFSLPVTVYVWRHPPRAYENWQCQRCGYPLFRVTGVTCPECGEPFDRDGFAAKYELEQNQGD